MIHALCGALAVGISLVAFGVFLIPMGGFILWRTVSALLHTAPPHPS